MEKTAKLEIVKVGDIATFNELYMDDALTIEGIKPESIPDFVSFVMKFAGLTRGFKVYLTSGDMMNGFCGCTGSNKYRADLNIASIMLKDMKEPGCVIIPRFYIGARWFSDIVDNNRRREGVEIEEEQ